MCIHHENFVEITAPRQLPCISAVAIQGIVILHVRISLKPLKHTLKIFLDAPYSTPASNQRGRRRGIFGAPLWGLLGGILRRME